MNKNGACLDEQGKWVNKNGLPFAMQVTYSGVEVPLFKAANKP